MSSLSKVSTSNSRKREERQSRRTGLFAGVSVLLALVLAACSSPPPAAEMPVPGDTPVSEMIVSPSVTVMDQTVVDGKVTIAQVVSDGPGWLVVHAQADGAPGPNLGYTAVADGTNADVTVELDLTGATDTLYAMLHADAGTAGTYEFPGDDKPVSVDGSVVNVPFQATVEMAAVTPSVSVMDQAVADGKVTVAQVVSDGPGWLVIHAQTDGAPGPVLGYTAVADGANADVTVELDLTGATDTLYAMLHTDAGTAGTYEFPGDDKPVSANDVIVMTPFNLQAAEGQAEVRMIDFAFDQASLLVRAGSTVTWINEDGARHTATSDTGIWDSGSFGRGDSFSFTFDEPGTYPYYCRPHGGPGGEGMAGTIVVLPSQG
jgi:plastocyanin